MTVRNVEAFLLSAEWRDTPRGLALTLWAKSAEGPVCATVTGQEAVMFVQRGWPAKAARREARPLKTLGGADVDALYFPSQRALLEAREQVRSDGGLTYEADVKPSHRFLMERFINGGLGFSGPARTENGILWFSDPKVRAADVTPLLTTLSIDIETSGWDGPVLSIALAGDGYEETFLVRGDERATLDAAFAAIRKHDPDVLIGWNVVEFDLRVLELRATALGLKFAIGRAGGEARVLPGGTVSIARVPGRVVLDGVATLKNASRQFERYTLEYVSREVLGRGKKGTFRTEDPDELRAYNLEDARLARDVFAREHLVAFAIARAKLTGLPMDRQGGSTAAFDHLYLPKLHRRGYVAPDVGAIDDPVTSPGGHVLDSKPGLFTNIGAFDFRSLYPSIVRTFGIDPLALHVPDAEPILPALITHLHGERTKAREAGDETLSTAIKILMNSFYGVLGSPGCRFFDPRLASGITLRGHEIIERSKQFFEARGMEVIYGDTDSLFVQLKDEAEGRTLAAELTAWWKDTIAREHAKESVLELRFDALFSKFLMPTMRGTEKGSKKRYAGLVGGKLVIRGLEAVRTDWTPLAREAQRELLRRLFAEEPWEDWLRGLRREVLAGTRDAQLVYRKRLRRDVDDYASAPPHVKAARMLGDTEPLNDVEYLMTTQGPMPVGQRTAPIDHAHYLEKQLAPAVDVALGLLGTSFEHVAGEQLRLW